MRALVGGPAGCRASILRRAASLSGVDSEAGRFCSAQADGELRAARQQRATLEQARAVAEREL
jgi:hypothetical protein